MCWTAKGKGREHPLGKGARHRRNDIENGYWISHGHFKGLDGGEWRDLAERLVGAAEMVVDRWWWAAEDAKSLR